MGYFAFEGGVRTEEQPGDIPISDEDYSAAIAGLMAGKQVSIADGFAVIDPPGERHWASATTGLYLGFNTEQPEDAVEVPTAPDDPRQVFDQGAWQPVSLEFVKRDLKLAVDADAETCRLKYITPGAGQAMTYQQKVTEAEACLADAEPQPASYPLLSAEVGITASDLNGVAEIVATNYQQWQVLGAAIEAIRLGAKKQIGEAVTAEDAQSVYDGVAWP